MTWTEPRLVSAAAPGYPFSQRLIRPLMTERPSADSEPFDPHFPSSARSSVYSAESFISRVQYHNLSFVQRHRSVKVRCRPAKLRCVPIVISRPSREALCRYVAENTRTLIALGMTNVSHDLKRGSIEGADWAKSGHKKTPGNPPGVEQHESRAAAQ